MIVISPLDTMIPLIHTTENITSKLLIFYAKSYFIKYRNQVHNPLVFSKYNIIFFTHLIRGKKQYHKVNDIMRYLLIFHFSKI